MWHKQGPKGPEDLHPKWCPPVTGGCRPWLLTSAFIGRNSFLQVRGLQHPGEGTPVFEASPGSHFAFYNIICLRSEFRGEMSGFSGLRTMHWTRDTRMVSDSEAVY